MNNWSMIQFLSKRGSENFIVACRCNNCGKIFYLYKTKFATLTYKLEDVGF
jgi:uncharacterized OB-fold protein